MFDLRKAEKAESGVRFEFTIDGQDFTFPPLLATDWHISSRIAEGDFAAAVKLLLGAKDFVRFDKLTLDMADLNALFEAYVAEGDTSLGESQASTIS